MTIADYTLAKRYAQAFMGLFGSTLTPEIIEHLQQFKQFISERKRVLFYVQLVFMNLEVKKDAITMLLRKFEVPAIFQRLIMLLISHRRLGLLPDVLEALLADYKQRHGIVEFTVTSAQVLSEQDLAAIKQFLTAQTHKKISMHLTVDKSLIAGLKLTSSTWGWEYSVRKQLQALEIR